MSFQREWIVSQIGARQHYTVPLGFHRLGNLHSFYTDLWCGASAPLLRRLGAKGNNFAGRSCPSLPSEKIVDFTFRTLWRSSFTSKERSLDERYDRYLRVGREFALSVSRHLKARLQSNSDIGEIGFFGFNTGSLETLQALKGSALTVVDQIDTVRIGEKIALEEVERWPGWQEVPGKIPLQYFERLSAEWEEANVVFVNSEWSRSALIQQGVPPEKIAVAPIAYGGPQKTVASRPNSDPNEPLRVLWLGQVNLLKGIPYLFEAARMVLDRPIEFRVYGQLMISDMARSTAPSNVRLEGPVPRLAVGDAYQWADVFVLPTLSDGFAITQLEAMAYGLPVIATPNCGEVVTDGYDGIMVPPRDASAIANALAKISEDRDLLAEMSKRAIAKVRQFDVLSVAKRRLQSINDCVSVGTCR